MTMDYEQLKNQLSDIEPTEATYAGIGVTEIPLLKRLMEDQEEEWMAARAVYALARLPEDDVVPILSRAAADGRDQVRIAVANVAARLRPPDASEILLRLLSDDEVGVVKFAIRSVSREHSDAVRAKVGEISRNRELEPIRDRAENKLRELQ